MRAGVECGEEDKEKVVSGTGEVLGRERVWGSEKGWNGEERGEEGTVVLNGEKCRDDTGARMEE